MVKYPEEKLKKLSEIRKEIEVMTVIENDRE